MNAPAETPFSAAIEAVLREIGDIPVVTERKVVRRRSRDFFWYSPILNEELADRSADIIVTPRSEEELLRLVRACVRRRVPVTPRGGATGNYGQAVPMERGVLLDMANFTQIEWIKPGVRAGAGAKMHELDFELRKHGQEQRLHPSTKRSATIGGFVAGGSGGVGSVTYGGLREPGNILAARIVTMEEEPRIIELRADAAQKINRAYGTTGIITVLEMPLAPAWPWYDVAVAFDSFSALLDAGHAAAKADGVVKKLMSGIASPLPDYFGPMKAHCPAGKAMLLAMISESSLESFRDVVQPFGGSVTLETPTVEEPGQIPLYEYTWNHTTLQVLKVDRSVTYLQCLYPHERVREAILETAALFPEELIPHCEFIRFGGHVSASALPVIRYRDKARLYEIINAHEAHGVLIANPHVISLEEGSRHKRADADQIGFKAEIDPYGLLNPGKMKSYVPVKA